MLRKMKTVLFFSMFSVIILIILGVNAASTITVYASDGAKASIEDIIANQNSDGGWKKFYNTNTGEWAKSTIDNGTTYTEIRKLAEEYNKTKNTYCLNACIKGINFLLKMQYENGGWPEIYKGNDYHAFIDYNDDSMINVMYLLDEVSQKKGEFAFIDDKLAAKCLTAVQKGIDCVLKTQIVYNGEKQAWCQQNDPVTLEPAHGRAFELVGNSASESIGVIRFLISRPNPSPEIKGSIISAVTWLKKVQINGIKVEKKGNDVVVVNDADAPPVWARFYEIGTDKPFFSTINGVKKYSLAEIDHERRVGYSWYGNWPQTLLAKDYPAWVTKQWDGFRNMIWCSAPLQ